VDDNIVEGEEVRSVGNLDVEVEDSRGGEG